MPATFCRLENRDFQLIILVHHHLHRHDEGALDESSVHSYPLTPQTISLSADVTKMGKLHQAGCKLCGKGRQLPVSHNSSRGE